jgi:hypothetical protein
MLFLLVPLFVSSAIIVIGGLFLWYRFIFEQIGRMYQWFEKKLS